MLIADPKTKVIPIKSNSREERRVKIIKERKKKLPSEGKEVSPVHAGHWSYLR